MPVKTLSIGLIVIGLLVIAVALSAGYIGLSEDPTIGTHKLMLAAVGLIVGIAGIVLRTRKPAR